MADTLKIQSPLAGKAMSLGETYLDAVEGFSLTSLAVPRKGEAAFAEAVAANLPVALPLPLPGQSTLSDNRRVRLISQGVDQYFLLNLDETHPDERTLGARLGDKAYLCDQSDAWVMLRLSGPSARAALERLCMLDLDPSQFPVHSAGRTTMEHLGVLIVAEAQDSFLLLSASSSAQSFWTAVEQSLTYAA